MVDEHADLAACLDGEDPLDAFERCGQRFEFFQALDVGFEGFTPGTGAGAGDGVRGLHDGGDQRGHLDLVVVGPDGVAHDRVLLVLAAQFHAYDGVRALDFLFDHLADVVQQPGPACQGGVEAEFGGHERGDAGRLDGVGKQVLPVARAVAHPADEADEFGMEAVQVQVDHRALTGFDDLFLDLGAGLLDHLFDPGRVDAAVLDQPVHGNPGDLATNRVEAGEDDRLGRVVHDDLDTRGGLEGPDVAAFAPDDPPFHLIRLDVHDRDGVLDSVVGRGALDGRQDNFACLAVGPEPGFVPDLLDVGSGFQAGFFSELLNKGLPCFFATQAGGLFQPAQLFFLHPCQLLALGFELFLERLDALFALDDLLVAAARLFGEGGRFAVEEIGPEPDLFGLLAQALDGIGCLVEQVFALVDLLGAPVELLLSLVEFFFRTS